ncbi:DUF397 domain-containing protein [Kitasatospora sp. RG8]|uniref:DUF397 domain-containing protein n=1 Tax=Kitasatospora sp. RG8 TaxID=2820815 RepID=UPI001ADEEAA4|nr:DUF397 domain-containing protein [Kitasatospora sp. RG8]MBP0450005.1 DUF397 domain-containing protein [Kitasatospora sp. RG8]
MPDPDWQKSSFSASNNECVEVRTADGLVELRESDAPTTILRTTPTTFAKLLQAAKAGEYDYRTALSP